MSLWAAAAPAQATTNAVTGTTTPYVNVTASATPHTMGSWTTLVAATPWPVDGITLWVYLNIAQAGVDTSMLFDIGVGAAASERVVIAGMPLGGLPTGARNIFLPIRIASGDRIAARAQSANASGVCAAALTLTGGGGWLRAPGGGVTDSYGVNSGTSSGIPIADIGSANTKSAYTELTSGTTRRHRFLLPAPCLAAGVTTIFSSSYLYDIAIGASGSEVVILPNLGVNTSTNEDIRSSTLQPFAVNLPAGTRLAARQQKSLSTGNPLSLTLIGID